MNDLGLTLAWLAVQVAILLAPALALNALASRRGPAAGAWVAVLSLGMVLALNVTALLPQNARIDTVVEAKVPPPVPAFEKNNAQDIEPSSFGHDVIHPAANRVGALEWLGLAWDRLGRTAAEPAQRARPWGKTWAAIALAGTAVGLLRLMIGLWAIAICCRRGRPVDDAGMTSLLAELQCAMACRRPVALREVRDLTTPATAGRRRPVLLLPGDWRSWTDAERRVVLAHELAHVVRGDYATGLLARLAVVLNYYHPLVRSMAGRLQLQQEQAADAMGAQFAGGRTCYMVALSSLALRQDGRSPLWPARAFLPARGTLIRRIAMLRDESNTDPSDRPLSPVRRTFAFFTLLGLTMGVVTLRGPARGADDGPPPAAKAEVAANEPRDQIKPFGPLYLREGADGVVIVRPAAALRHNGMDKIVPWVSEEAMGFDFPDVARQLKVDTSRPGFVKLRAQDIERVTASVSFGRDSNDKFHRLMFASPTVRMVAPFDWLAFLRQWRLELEEARVKDRTYYKIKGVLKELLGVNPCVFLPDDRTIVGDEEDVIRKIAGGEGHALPDLFRGKEWAHASRGLVAIAIKNNDDTFTKHFDLGRPDDAVALSLFKGLDAWVLGVDDSDAIVLRADAIGRNRNASEAVCRQIDSLIKLGRQFLQQLDPKSPEVASHELYTRMLKALAANVRVEHTDTGISVQAQNFGSLGDFALIVAGEAQESRAPVAARKDALHSVTQ
jgi:beta-lactamase regulating signal transducer with metallopeptidase domain